MTQRPVLIEPVDRAHYQMPKPCNRSHHKAPVPPTRKPFARFAPLDTLTLTEVIDRQTLEEHLAVVARRYLEPPKSGRAATDCDS